MQDENKLCYVCSPYRGDIERNVAYARKLTKLALDAGLVPITPHLYLTQVLDENNPAQRGIGLTAGLCLLYQCSHILIGVDYGISEGMWNEIKAASRQGKIMLWTRSGHL